MVLTKREGGESIRKYEVKRDTITKGGEKYSLSVETNIREQT